MLLAGSMVLSNVDEHLSNVDEPNMFTLHLSSSWTCRDEK